MRNCFETIEIHCIQIAHQILPFSSVDQIKLVETFVVCFLLNLDLDISIATVDLMQELTDVDTLTENDEDATALIGALVCVHCHTKFKPLTSWFSIV